MNGPRWLLRADPPKDQPKRVQVEALVRSYGKEGWSHYLDLGLGKTAVGLNEFMLYVEDFSFERMVIWAPNNFKPDWAEMAKEFKFPYPIYTFSSDDRRGFDVWMKRQTGPCGVAINYEAAIYPKSTELIRQFVKGRRAFVFYDESIWLKNPMGQVFRALFAMRDLYAASRNLSGKPMTQGPHDLWAQLKMIGALDGWSFMPFRNRYCLRGGFRNRQVIGSKNEEELNSYIAKWAFIASKLQWSDLRAPGYTVRTLQLTADQLERYKTMEEDFMIDLGEGRIASADMVITRLNKLQQITSGFLIDDDGAAHDVIPIGKNPKIAAIRAFMDDEVNGKLIVGVVHTHARELLLEGLSKWKPVWIAGQMPADQIKEHKRLFNSNSGADILIGQIRATKYGHTLLGDQDAAPCYNTAFFENSYSLDDRTQFEGRNHREGQRFDVLYTDFVATAIDRRVIHALQRKESIASAVLGYACEHGVLAGVEV